MSAQPEVWRVNTPEGIFETDLETLKQWILEGCVLPTDKVSKGNLSWIDAGRVPKLKGAFNGEVTPVCRTSEQLIYRSAGNELGRTSKSFCSTEHNRLSQSSRSDSGVYVSKLRRSFVQGVHEVCRQGSSLFVVWRSVS
jgi:hypothetical protein